MIMITVIFLLFNIGLIEHTSSIQCYTCTQLNNDCPLPLNLDGGDESNENDVDVHNYHAGFACLSDHSVDPRTGKEKIILRGIADCEEINIPNRRVHCCYVDNCNKQLPPMTVKTLADPMEEEINNESNFNIGLIEHTSSIQCYTCGDGELNFYCTLPLNFDGGDESNENDVDVHNYHAGFACLSDHSVNPRTGTEKIILRGIDYCEEINIPNRRVHCCYFDHCNKQLPPMTVKTITDLMGEGYNIESNCQHYISSIILISFSIIFQYFY